MKIKPVSESIFPWLKANLGPDCLAPLTGTDYRALRAAVQTVELYSYDPAPEVLQAFCLVVNRMQTSTRELAFHAIAHVMDWSDRDTLWAAAGLLPFKARRRCAYEPGGGEPVPSVPVPSVKSVLQ